MKTFRKEKETSFLSLFLCFVFFSGSIDIKAQDVTFSQFFNNPLYYNPAFAGSDLGMRTRLNYRNQWHNLPSNYNNYTFSLDIAERNIPGSGGMGIIVNSDFDGIGQIKTTSATFANAARISIQDNLITQVGISASFVTKSIDWNNLVFSDQLDPRHGIVNYSSFQPPEYSSIAYPDFAFGGLLRYFDSSPSFNTLVITLSAAMHHAFQPDISFTGNGTKLPYRLVFSGNVLWDDYVNSYSRSSNSLVDKVNPGFLYEKQGDMSNFMLGANFYKNYIYYGAWVRSQSFTYTRVNDFILMLGINVPVGESSRIKFMYTYDYVLSDLRRSVGSTHEISAVFELDGFSFFGSFDGGRNASRSASGGLPGRRNQRNMDCLDCSSF